MLPNPHGGELAQDKVKTRSLLLVLCLCCAAMAKLFKVVNPLVVSAGTWKHKRRMMKEHQLESCKPTFLA